MVSIWDNYYYTRYKPVRGEWSIADLNVYKRWYGSWLTYIFSLHPELETKTAILEIGCGIGAVTSLLRDKGHHVIGSDISPRIVSIASRLNPTADFHCFDVQKEIPIHEIFDIIFAFEVLEHLEKPEKAIKNIRMKLKPGGYFIASTPYPFRKNFDDATHINVKYPGDWLKILKKSGFTHITASPMSFIPFFWRLHGRLNPVIPLYIPFPWFVSTTLLCARI